MGGVNLRARNAVEVIREDVERDVGDDFHIFTFIKYIMFGVMPSLDLTASRLFPFSGRSFVIDR